jgi:anti-sigma B factor antagonist
MYPNSTSLQITTEQRGNISIVTVNGLISDSYINELKSTMKAILDRDITNLIIDCTGVKAIDSRGLGFLITIQKVIRSREGRMVLVNLSAHFAALLELTRLNRILEIFMDMETAIHSFGTPPTGKDPAV